MIFLEIANIEKYMPTVYQAEILVKNNLETYRRQGIKAFKIIHGYGSTGKGGALRTGIRNYLDQLKGAKIIADYIPGEDWSAFNETTRKVLDLDNSFRKEARKKVELITNGDENTRRRLFNSMKNIKPEYLL